MDQKVEQTPSSATSQSYIEKALAHGYNSESLRVESFHSEAITQNGENFCSVIYRLKVSFRRSENAPLEHGNYIVKDLIPMMASLGSTEKLMYEQILPALEQILDKTPTTVGNKKLNANCFFVERSKAKELYVLEDLGALGYVTLNRYTGLSADEARVCLQKMALFHAASMQLIHEQPALVSQLPTSHYAKGINDEFTEVLLLDGTSFAADVVESLPEISPIAAKMRAQLPDEFSKRMKACVDPKQSAFQVICHGDIWLNNMMVNRNENTGIIVDFQSCFIGSPAIDLHFFFHTSLKLDVLLNQREELLKYYHQILSESLSACNYPGPMPTLAQVLDEMQRCLYYGYYATVCELPICSAPEDASKDFTVYTFAEDKAIEAKRRQLFKNERVRQTLLATMGHFEEQDSLIALAKVSAPVSVLHLDLSSEVEIIAGEKNTTSMRSLRLQH